MTAHPEFAQHGTFAHLKLGRTKPRHDARTLSLAKYLDTAALPPVPATADYTDAITAFGMMGNDQYGDCTCAGIGHLVQVWTANAGKEVTVTDSDVLNFYWATGDPPNTPSPPGGATDDGRDELSVLKYWKANGFAGNPLGAYVSVNPQNPAEVRAALYLFGCLYTGVELPLSAQGQSEWDVVGDGKTGNSAPGSWGGHCVTFPRYDAASFTCITWGGLVQLTEQFFAAYFDEVWACVGPEWFTAGGNAVNGFDAAQLQADLAAVSA